MRTRFLLTILALGLAAWAKPPLDTVLYGAAYYPEYMPYERADKDIELMKKAGVTVVRVGESTWSSWEPADGKFEFAWMDRVLDKLHAAGIRVIFGTPTYSIPVWLYKKHPEILVAHNGTAPPMTDPYYGTYPGLVPGGAYGPRQNMDLTNPDYLRYSERIIRQLIGHFAKHPAIIGYQVDNETGPNGLPLANVQRAFVERLKEKFGTVEAVNKAWGLVYWGQLVGNWDEFPARDGILNPGYKLEWERHQRTIVEDFLAWQARIVRELKRPDQFVTHDFVGGLRTNIDQWKIARHLDIAGANPYHVTQDRLTGEELAFTGDVNRPLKQQAYLVTETNAQGIGWDSRAQFPMYDGQLRLCAWASVASGAAMVEYWHWHSLHYGQETYWRGVLGHDLEPNRTYAEASRIGAEFKKHGPRVVLDRKDNRVAILASLDSNDGLRFMPVSDRVNYMTVLMQMWRALYAINVEVDVVSPDTAEWSRYKVLLVPPLYVADDALLQRIAGYVRGGGHAVVAFKSGYTNENSTVRWTTAPGPLREAAGIRYQEFTTLPRPLGLTPDAFGLGEKNQASAWAEMVVPEKAQAVLRYSGDFLGKYAAVARNAFGKGTLTYEGTFLSDELQQALVGDAVKRAGLSAPQLPAGVKLRQGFNAKGETVRFYLNFTGRKQTVAAAEGESLLDGRAVKGPLDLEPWGVAVVVQ